MSYAYAEPIVVAGTPFERGLAIARRAGPHADAIGKRIRSAPQLQGDEAGWVEAQWDMQRAHLPQMCQFMDGLAEGYGVATRALFGRHVGYALEDRRRAAATQGGEECSAFAIRTDRGVLVAKNRDNPPEFKPLQTLILQSDPAWGGRRTLSISTHGSSAAASSGMNSDGLAMADTSVRTLDVDIGVLRYYLMDAILYRCGTVAEAVAFVRSMPHLGGGNLVLGDAGGAIARIQLGHEKIVVTQDPECGWLACTNHFLDPGLAARLVHRPGSPQREDSEGRLAFAVSRLGNGVSGWTAEDCMAVLASRGGDGHAALCRDLPDVLTLSGAVFDPGRRELLQSRGRPSGGDWRRTGFD